MTEEKQRTPPHALGDAQEEPVIRVTEFLVSQNRVGVVGVKGGTHCRLAASPCHKKCDADG